MVTTQQRMNSTLLRRLGLSAAAAQPLKTEPAAVVSSAANDQLLYFTSDKPGKRAVFRVAAPATLESQPRSGQ